MTDLPFDPAQDPATPEEIGRRRDKAENEASRLRKAAKDLDLVCIMLCIPAAIGVFVIGTAIAHPSGNVPAAAVTLAFPYALICMVSFALLDVSLAATVFTTIGAALTGLGTIHLLTPQGTTINPFSLLLGAAAATLFGLCTAHLRARFLDHPIERLDQTAAGLDPIDPAQCPQTLEWCRRHPALAGYQAKVARLDRTFTKAERARIAEWVRLEEARRRNDADEEAQRAACLALRNPLTP